MPWQNRVTPFGEIIATPERGTFLGNRGILHDGDGRIRRAWQVKRWLICVLEFRGKWRQVMAPRRYTHLFFLDEATALAAGHRPCAECRHARFIDFCVAWKRAHPHSSTRGTRPRADDIDAQLHAERLGPHRSKAVFTAALEQLPDGVLVTAADSGDEAYLVRGNALLGWSPGGYGPPQRRPSNLAVRVLTPRSTVRAITAGYVPEIHRSAAGAGG
jgi:hypothetical protein